MSKPDRTPWSPWKKLAVLGTASAVALGGSVPVVQALQTVEGGGSGSCYSFQIVNGDVTTCVATGPVNTGGGVEYEDMISDLRTANGVNSCTVTRCTTGGR